MAGIVSISVSLSFAKTLTNFTLYKLSNFWNSLLAKSINSIDSSVEYELVKNNIIGNFWILYKLWQLCIISWISLFKRSPFIQNQIQWIYLSGFFSFIKALIFSHISLKTSDILYLYSMPLVSHNLKPLTFSDS